MVFMASRLVSDGNGNCPFLLQCCHLMDTVSGNLAQIQGLSGFTPPTDLAHVCAVRIFLTSPHYLAKGSTQTSQSFPLALCGDTLRDISAFHLALQ